MFTYKTPPLISALKFINLKTMIMIINSILAQFNKYINHHLNIFKDAMNN